MDLARFEDFVRNFKSGVVSRISVPFSHPKDPAELAAVNRGELIDMWVEGDGSKDENGLYGLVEIRDSQTAALKESLCAYSLAVTAGENQSARLGGSTLSHLGSSLVGLRVPGHDVGASPLTRQDLRASWR